MCTFGHVALLMNVAVLCVFAPCTVAVGIEMNRGRAVDVESRRDGFEEMICAYTIIISHIMHKITPPAYLLVLVRAVCGER